MKVGIYNMFLSTMGGGERHMGMAAEVLAQAGHDVELITHVPVSLATLSQKLNLDLDGVRVRTTPLLPFDQLADLTREYDLFVNTSHMSAVPSRAPRSLLLIFFPFPLDRTPFGRFKRRVAAHIHRQLLVPRYGAGFYGPQTLGGSRYRWTAGRGQMTVETPWPGRPLRLRLVVGSFRPADWGAVPLTLKANDRSVLEAEVKTTPGDYVTLDATVPGELTRGGQVALQLESPTYRPFEVGGSSGEPDDYREVGLAVARIMAHHPRHYLYEALFERLVPELGLRLHGLPDERAMGYLETYDVIAPISDFSNHWLQRYWAKQGTVLYPPVDVEALSPRETRRPIILSVGRFFRGSHNKKHDAMIRTFGRLVRDGLRGWELHLVGSLTPEASTREAENRRYLDECRRLAQGLPVHLHVDAPAAELKTLYETASIYWHATGYGEHVGRDPAKFEHFGITTVEAMAGGCVPVVIGKGAQPEIVEDGRSGFLWRTAAEWRQQTLAVATDAGLAERLRRGAIEASKRFSEGVFRAHLLEIVRGLGVSPAG